MKKWQGNDGFVVVHLPIQPSVGVGGLEPPTSASQTRRAGRLRYTPADKSIIRTMGKRQDIVHVLFQNAAYLVCVLILMFSGAACQAGESPATIVPLEPAPAQTTAMPVALHTASVTPIALEAVSATPTAQEPSPTPGITMTSIDCRFAGGQVLSEALFSEHLGEDLHYLLYLPPCYHEGLTEDYPVTYLLHGLSYTQDQWVRLGVAEQMDALISEGRIAPFIIVMPTEARFQPPLNSAFADALVQELIPFVDQQYRTLPERAYRAIGGLSRGAAWAVHLGFEHPHLFSRVGAHSLPLFEVDGGRLDGWLAETPDAGLPDFFIDIGRSDPERWSAQNFADLLNAYHIPHTWYLFNGGHTEAYWSTHLELYLHWYAQDWY